MLTRQDLDHNEYNAYYKNYIELVNPDIDLYEALDVGLENTLKFYGEIPQDKWCYAYASGKWTILEVLQHVIDTERIFAYRALCIGRGDQTPLPGFEQDDYILPAQANARSLIKMLEEFEAVRSATLYLFKSFGEKALAHKGMASDSNLTARAAGFIICGHDMHHANIVQQRYL